MKILAISLYCLELLSTVVDYQPSLVQATCTKSISPTISIWHPYGNEGKRNMLDGMNAGKGNSRTSTFCIFNGRFLIRKKKILFNCVSNAWLVELSGEYSELCSNLCFSEYLKCFLIFKKRTTEAPLDPTLKKTIKYLRVFPEFFSNMDVKASRKKSFWIPWTSRRYFLYLLIFIAGIIKNEVRNSITRFVVLFYIENNPLQMLFNVLFRWFTYKQEVFIFPFTLWQSLYQST